MKNAPKRSAIQRTVNDQLSTRESRAIGSYWNSGSSHMHEIEAKIQVCPEETPTRGAVFVSFRITRAEFAAGNPTTMREMRENEDSVELESELELDTLIDALVAARDEARRAGTFDSGRPAVRLEA